MSVELICSCGAVEGEMVDATASSGSRIVCCCDDCQAFADHLSSDTGILDEFGGTEIYQTSQAQVRINKGHEQLRCLRLSSKGIYRWYTHCCRTPIGNTLGAGMPFVGVVHSFMTPELDRDAILGPVRAYMQTKHARGTPTHPKCAKGFPPGIMFRTARKLLVWKLRGWNTPSAFFNPDGKAIVKPVILADKA